MSTFTTQITDQVVIAELPDTSILNTLHDDTLTSEELGQLLSSVSFRKKLQVLFEFSFSESTREIIKSKLMEAHEVYEVGQGNTVTYSGEVMLVNGRAISSDFGTFSSGIFSDETFATLFISSEIMDIIFTSEDKTFVNSLLNIPKFWDKLILNNDVYQHVIDTYNSVLLDSIKKQEVPYVKYIASIIGLETTRYNKAIHLAEDGSVMEAIWTDSNAKSIESDAMYGVTARLMYVFGNVDIESIQNSEESLSRIESDTALQQFITDIDVLRQLDPQSLVAKFILDHDGRFGAMASTMLDASVALNISNIFYDNEYSSVLAGFVRNDELVAYLMGSTLYSTFADRFYTAFIGTVNNIQKYAVQITSSGELEIVYADKSFKSKSLTVVLDDFTETKAGTSHEIETVAGIFKIAKVFNDSSIMGITLDRSIEFTNSGNELIFNEFVGIKIDDVTSSGGHVFGIDSSGNTVSSKFVNSIDLSSEEVQKVFVYDESAFVITSSTIHAIGNIGADANGIRNRIIIEKDSINSIAHAHERILVLVDGDIKEVTADALVSYGSLDSGIVSEMFVVDGSLVILDNAGNMFELNESLTTDIIATDVSQPEQAQEAMYIKIAGDRRLVFKFNNSWLTYNHIAGGIEE